MNLFLFSLAILSRLRSSVAWQLYGIVFLGEPAPTQNFVSTSKEDPANQLLPPLHMPHVTIVLLSPPVNKKNYFYIQ